MKNLLYSYLFLLLIIITSSIDSIAQDTLNLVPNPSFESKPLRGRLYTTSENSGFIETWLDSGKFKFPNESRSDIFPIDDIQIEESVGYTYLGMVVRDNDSYEEISS